MEAITEDKEVSIIEPGNEQSVLRSVQRQRMGPDTVQAIRKKHNVGAVVLGNLEIFEVKLGLKVSSLVKSVGVKAEIDAFMTAKLLETEHGTTVWTGSAHDTKAVARITMFPGGRTFFDARDPDECCGDLVESLIGKITADFRLTYKRR